MGGPGNQLADVRSTSRVPLWPCHWSAMDRESVTLFPISERSKMAGRRFPRPVKWGHVFILVILRLSC